MPFVDTPITPRRIGLLRQRIRREAGEITIFEPSPDPVPTYLQPSITISTLGGALLGDIPTGIQNTILNSIEYVNSERGSDEAVLILNNLPAFPISAYSTISISVDGVADYTGYLWKPNDPGNQKNRTFKYEFFGLRKKYEKVPIETTQNFTISSITQSGSTSRYNVTTTTAGIGTNQMAATRNCTDDLNNGYRLITAVGVNWFEVTNAVGVAQAGAAGDIRVLPAEWSSSNLISLLFTQLVTTYGTGLGIGYVPAKIEDSTGSNTLGYVDFNGSTLQDAIEMLEKMTVGSYTMGVDRAGDYFFKAVPSAVQGNINVGYDAHDFTLTRNFEKIINVVDVRRAKGHSEGGNGWITASIGSDATSIAKYGRRNPSEATITIPEYFSDEVADLIRDNTLASFKDPKYHCTIKKLKFDRVFNTGFYRFSSYPDTYSTVFNELDSLTGWTVGANISATISTSTLVTGAGCFKLDLTSSSNGQSVTKSGLSYSIRGKKRLMFWVRGTVAGQFLEVSFTDGTNTTSANVYISTPNEFYYFTLDISDSLIETITSLSFNISGVTSSQTIYIDEISIEQFASLQIVMPFKKVKTYLRSHEFVQDLELGLQYDKLSEYMQGLQTQVSSHNIFLKDRTS